MVISPLSSPCPRRRRRGSGLSASRARRDHLRRRNSGRRTRVCGLALHARSVTHIQGRPDAVHAAFAPCVRRVDAGEHRQVRWSHAGTGRGSGEACARDFGIGLLRWRGMCLVPAVESTFLRTCPPPIIMSRVSFTSIICVCRFCDLLRAQTSHLPSLTTQPLPSSRPLAITIIWGKQGFDAYTLLSHNHRAEQRAQQPVGRLRIGNRK